MCNYAVASYLRYASWKSSFNFSKVIQLLACKHQHGIKQTTLLSSQWKCVPCTSINYYTSHVFVKSVTVAWSRLSAASPQQEQGGQPLLLCLSFTVIIFTRQLGDRPRCFDVTVSFVVHRAAAWSALIPTTVWRLKLVKQELDNAIVCPVNGRTSFASSLRTASHLFGNTRHVTRLRIRRELLIKTCR